MTYSASKYLSMNLLHEYKKHYRAVIISPHFDDAVFSCGGLINQLVKEGPVLIYTIFTDYLSGIKIHGVVLSETRQQEEIDAAHFLGFESRQSFYDYEKEGEFSYTIKKARLKIESCYEQNLHSGNPSGSIFALKNLGWSDKQEIEHSGDIGTYDTTDARNRLIERLAAKEDEKPDK